MTITFSVPQSQPESRLKVLFITPWYPENENPVSGIFVREHAKAVSQTDDVVVVHLKGNNPHMSGMFRILPEDNAELHQGIETYHLIHRLSPIPKTTFPLFVYSVFQAYQYLIKMGFRPDLLHAHIFNAGFPAVLVGKMNRIPTIVTEQNSAFPRRLLNKRDIFLARIAFSHAAMVLPVSVSLQKAIQSYGIKANFRIVPNVADTMIFTPPAHIIENKETIRLLFVGTLVPVKGLPHLFQALMTVKQMHVNWRLDLIGDGSERRKYEYLVKEYGLEQYITFHGIKPKTIISEWMRQADLFVLPSLWDNFPCVLVEAMASGLPVLATRTGGIPEIVTEDTGVLVPPEDPDSLARALVELIGGGIKRFDRQKIAQYAQKFSPQVVGKLLHSIYEEVLNDPQARTM
jgi:glycosyltransferase involved in cell wall biosynthesis